MNTSKKSLMGLVLFTLALSSCKITEETLVTPEVGTGSETAGLITTANEALGFTYTYPSTFTVLKSGDKYLELYNEEDYATKKEQDEGPGAGAIPPTYSFEMTDLGDTSLEQFVLNRIGYGSEKSLSDIEGFNSPDETSDSPMVYAYETIGNNNVLRVATVDMFYVISYYIENPEKNSVMVVSTYLLSDDNESLKEILKSIQIN